MWCGFKLLLHTNRFGLILVLNLILAFLDARNADIERLDATVWRNAFSYMMINWGTWSQQLHLPEKLRAYFPGGKFGAADVEDQQMGTIWKLRNHNNELHCNLTLPSHNLHLAVFQC